MCISVVWVEKKKSRPTDPSFFQTCYSKHTYFLFGLITAINYQLPKFFWIFTVLAFNRYMTKLGDIKNLDI